MNAITRTEPRRFGARVLGLVAAATLALGAIGVVPAVAADRHGHPGHARAYHGHYHGGGGYYYGAPPVVYGGYSPGYYYGPDYYAPPPVVYGAPGVGIGVNLPGLSIGVGVP
jgi:hypothetical protein